MKVILSTYDGQETEYRLEPGLMRQGPAIPCFRCGECCVNRRPILAKGDIIAMSQGLGMSLLSFYRKYIRRHPSRPKTYIFWQCIGDCPFLLRRGEETSCAIHEFKPAACHAWTPSLWREECITGLKKRLNGLDIMSPDQIYGSAEELAAFCRSLEEGG
ncbi:MAG: hypothetical protein A2Y60_02085 [Chloroflexi bacterium RBG_13_54_9]|nr:MAG: hypothetical protein A2Y60_02085 [Chloroflexi bacterium RBG_13_54_9]